MWVEYLVLGIIVIIIVLPLVIRMYQKSNNYKFKEYEKAKQRVPMEQTQAEREKGHFCASIQDVARIFVKGFDMMHPNTRYIILRMIDSAMSTNATPSLVNYVAKKIVESKSNNISVIFGKENRAGGLIHNNENGGYVVLLSGQETKEDFDRLLNSRGESRPNSAPSKATSPAPSKATSSNIDSVIKKYIDDMSHIVNCEDFDERVVKEMEQLALDCGLDVMEKTTFFASCIVGFSAVCSTGILFDKGSLAEQTFSSTVRHSRYAVWDNMFFSYFASRIELSNEWKEDARCLIPAFDRSFDEAFKRFSKEKFGIEEILYNKLMDSRAAKYESLIQQQMLQKVPANMSNCLFALEQYVSQDISGEPFGEGIFLQDTVLSVQIKAVNAMIQETFIDWFKKFVVAANQISME